jgi:hypothetical protein
MNRILVCFLLCATALGAVANQSAAERHLSNYWPGEYPSGVEVMRNTVVFGRSVANLEAAKNIRCELPGGLWLHPWSRKDLARGTRYVYISTPIKYEVLEDLELEDRSLKQGDLVEELAYLSEG